MTIFADGPEAGIINVLYCAVVDARFVAEASPCVLANVTVLVIDNAPATDVSMYCDSPLLVTSPQAPDSVPVTGRGSAKRVVRFIVMFYSVSTRFH